MNSKVTGNINQGNIGVCSLNLTITLAYKSVTYLDIMYQIMTCSLNGSCLKILSISEGYIVNFQMFNFVCSNVLIFIQSKIVLFVD